MPLYLQDWNWSDLLYGLIPILYILSQFLGSKQDKKKEPGPPAEQAQEEIELAERRRRIQEEIRRRIQGLPPEPEPEVAAPEVSRTEVPPVVRKAEDRTRARTTPARPATDRRPAAPVASPVYGSDIEQRLAAQRERLKQAESARAAARKQAGAMTSSLIDGDLSHAPGISSGRIYQSEYQKRQERFRKGIQDALRTPDRVRTAVILAEVLGPPIGARPEIGERLF